MSTCFQASGAELNFVSNKDKISDLLQSCSEILQQLLDFKRVHQTSFDIIGPNKFGQDAQVLSEGDEAVTILF